MKYSVPLLLGTLSLIGLPPLSDGSLAAPQSGGSGNAHERSLPAGSSAALKLFGCIVPLPPGYFLHVDSASAENLEFNRLVPPGYLRVRPYEPYDEDFFDMVDSEDIGPLTVVRLITKAGKMRYRLTSTIIHDGQRSLVIAGEDEGWAKPMARYCAEHPLRQR